MKAKLLQTMPAGPTAPDSMCHIELGRRFLMAGTIIDHPDCWRLVHGGIAEAEDAECKAKIAGLDQTNAGVMRRVHNRIMKEMAESQEEYQAAQEAAEMEGDEDEFES